LKGDERDSHKRDNIGTYERVAGFITIWLFLVHKWYITETRKVRYVVWKVQSQLFTGFFGEYLPERWELCGKIFFFLERRNNWRV